MEAHRCSPTVQPDYAGAVAMLEALCAPAEAERLAKSIATLNELTRRSSSEPDLQLRAYVAKLREYPADIAINALNTWPEKSQWFPTWFELREHMKFWADKRREMLEAVRFEAEKTTARSA